MSQLGINYNVLASILGAGLAGNLISMGIFSRKKFEKFTAKVFYRASLVVDSLNLVLLVNSIVHERIEFSIPYCKISQSLVDILPAYSAWILVLISVERFVSIVYPTSKMAKVFSTRLFQIASLVGILLSCFFFYTIDWLFFEVTYVVFTNDSFLYYDTMTNDSTTYCFIETSLFTVNSYIKLALSCLLPFILLITLSLMIINSMRIARQRISRSNSAIAKKRLQRDIRFAQTILLLDFVFLFFNFPFVFFNYIGNYIVFNPSSPNFSFYLSLQLALGYLFYLGPAVNVLVYLIFNRNFREEFLIVLKQVETHFVVSTSFRNS